MAMTLDGTHQLPSGTVRYAGPLRDLTARS